MIDVACSEKLQLSLDLPFLKICTILNDATNQELSCPRSDRHSGGYQQRFLKNALERFGLLPVQVLDHY